VTFVLLLFGGLRGNAGCDSIEIELPAAQGTVIVADLLQACAQQHPQLAAWLPHVRVAVDAEYVRNADPVPPGAEIALLPPVSGGRL
jgi:molybdopterin synthase catalytic subunit